MNTINPRILHEQSLMNSLARFSDGACVLIGFAVAGFCPGVLMDSQLSLAAAIGVILQLLFGELTGLYRSWRGVSMHREVATAIMTWGYGLAVLLVLGFLTRYTDQLPRSGIAVGAATVALFL